MAFPGSTPVAIAVGGWILIAIAVLLILAVAVTVVQQLPELRRYMKIRSM